MLVKSVQILKKAIKKNNIAIIFQYTIYKIIYLKKSFMFDPSSYIILLHITSVKFWIVRIFNLNKILHDYLNNIMIILIHQTIILMYSRCSFINDSLGEIFWNLLLPLEADESSAIFLTYNVFFWSKNVILNFSFLCYCVTDELEFSVTNMEKKILFRLFKTI